LIITDQLTTFY